VIYRVWPWVRPGRQREKVGKSNETKNTYTHTRMNTHSLSTYTPDTPQKERERLIHRERGCKKTDRQRRDRDTHKGKQRREENVNKKRHSVSSSFSRF
jgi:hypothetical protein